MRCFSSPTYLPPSGGSGRITARGLPHSETTGSRPDCGSPVVSLLVCVLHRLVVPRHPPPAHHVLPGHGSLGSRGQRPRRVWLGPLAHEWDLSRSSRRQCLRAPGTKDLKKYQSHVMQLLRYGVQGTQCPCPLTCAACTAGSLHGPAAVVWNRIQLPPGPLGFAAVGDCVRAKLPRKEVIQPHLPVRLPCYDFVPVARPTLGRCLHLAAVGPRTSGVPDSHDVTGGVYKARVRIHRALLTRGY